MDRLATNLWVSAQIRWLFREGYAAYVLHKGDPHAGSVLLKIHHLQAGYRIFGQARDGTGKLFWMDAHGRGEVTEAEADAYIEKAVRLDPDLWVIEIEVRDGSENPLQGQAFP